MTLDVPLPPSDGFALNTTAKVGRLAIGRDGLHYVLLHTFMSGADSGAPARDARIELLAVAADGAIQRRQVLPFRHNVSSDGFALDSLGVIVARSGDLAVFVSGFGAMAASDAQPATATLFHLGADFSLKKATRLSPPRGGADDPDSFYGITAYQPTPDNGIVLGGGYGPGPLVWWMGKFTLGGMRQWQLGPGRSFPEMVAAMGPRPDAGWLSLVQQMATRDRPAWMLLRTSAAGKQLARLHLAQPADAVGTVLTRGLVMIINASDRAPRGELVVLDDAGKVTRRAPWPFAQTQAVVPAGNGIAAIVADAASGGEASQVVRADLTGAISWRSGVAVVNEIAATPDGQIAALMRSGDGRTLRLIRYADP
ncbi:MAG TPA: hypothetical protein VJ890_17255 [Vineibacter sp.]|nr:hypothetical protein [Vineibacter sp.]